jgi:hypothetical protein
MVERLPWLPRDGIYQHSGLACAGSTASKQRQLCAVNQHGVTLLRHKLVQHSGCLRVQIRIGDTPTGNATNIHRCEQRAV